MTNNPQMTPRIVGEDSDGVWICSHDCYVEDLRCPSLACRKRLQHIRVWRHKKRGTEYTEIGRGIFQIAAETSIADEEPVVIYRGDDNRLWVRPVAEFEDGRFEELQP